MIHNFKIKYESYCVLDTNRSSKYKFVSIRHDVSFHIGGIQVQALHCLFLN